MSSEADVKRLVERWCVIDKTGALRGPYDNQELARSGVGVLDKANPHHSPHRHLLLREVDPNALAPFAAERVRCWRGKDGPIGAHDRFRWTGERMEAVSQYPMVKPCDATYTVEEAERLVLDGHWVECPDAPYVPADGTAWHRTITNGVNYLTYEIRDGKLIGIDSRGQIIRENGGTVIGMTWQHLRSSEHWTETPPAPPTVATPPTTGRNAPLYDPAGVAFKPSPSPSVPTPEQVAECGAWQCPQAAVTATLRAEVERLTDQRDDAIATIRTQVEALAEAKADNRRLTQTLVEVRTQHELSERYHSAANGRLLNSVASQTLTIAALTSDLGAAMAAKSKLIDERTQMHAMQDGMVRDAKAQAETIDDLEQARRHQYDEIERLNTTIADLEAKLAEAESESEYRRTMWMRTKDERNNLTANLAAGGGVDKEPFPMLRINFVELGGVQFVWCDCGPKEVYVSFPFDIAEKVVARHAALAAKGAERG